MSEKTCDVCTENEWAHKVILPTISPFLRIKSVSDFSKHTVSDIIIEVTRDIARKLAKLNKL